MQISNRRMYRALPLLMLMVVALSVMARAVTEENPEVSKLLEQAKAQALILSQDADQMEALPRTEASWQSHAEVLDTVKQHVNDLAQVVQKLNASRNSAAPWQQQAIDRIVPLLNELAANTSAAIQHLNRNQVRPVSGNYPEYLRAGADTAHELATTISNFVEYGRARARMEQLEQQLEIARK